LGLEQGFPKTPKPLKKDKFLHLNILIILFYNIIKIQNKSIYSIEDYFNYLNKLKVILKIYKDKSKMFSVC
jgi:hypothetical protein